MGLTTTKEWRWDAPGAHTLTGAVGSARILLRDFLEECGWSVIWEDAGAQKVVLRNSQAHGGSGCYVRILDDGSFTGGSRVARIDVYEAMTDIDTGTATAGGGYFWKDRTGSGGPNAYTLHGDQRTAYSTVYVGGPTPPAVAGFPSGYLTHAGVIGDIDPAIPSDPGVICALPQQQNPDTSTVHRNPSPIFHRPRINAVGYSASHALSRTSALIETPTPCAVLTPGLGGSNPDSGFGIGGSEVVINQALSPGMAARLFIPALCVGGGAFRGRFRGLFVPLTYAGDAGVHVGSIYTPAGMSQSLSLATLAGSANDFNGDGGVGRLFVERAKSWDDF